MLQQAIDDTHKAIDIALLPFGCLCLSFCRCCLSICRYRLLLDPVFHLAKPFSQMTDLVGKCIKLASNYIKLASNYINLVVKNVQLLVVLAGRLHQGSRRLDKLIELLLRRWARHLGDGMRCYWEDNYSLLQGEQRLAGER